MPRPCGQNMSCISSPPVSSKRHKSGPATPGFTVDALVASWTRELTLLREGFAARVTNFVAHLPHGSVVQFAMRRQSSSRLSLDILARGIDGAELIADQLGPLLSDRESPVFAPRRDANASSELANTPAQLYEFKRLIFAPERSASREGMPLVIPATPASAEGFCQALLAAHPTYELRITLTPLALTTLDSENYAELLGASPPSARCVASTIAERGPLLQVQVLLGGPAGQLDALLASELSRRAAPVFPTPVASPYVPAGMTVWHGGPPAPLSARARPEDSVVGSRVAAHLLPIPVAKSASYAGFEVMPAGAVRAELGVVESSLGDGIRLGTSVDPAGNLLEVKITTHALPRHVYVPGQTGAGKSTALRAMACEFARSGNGFLFLDPHGETARELLRELPAERVADIVFIDCADPVYPAPINPFAVSDPLQRDAALADTAAMFIDLFDPHQQGIVGPRWEAWYRMAMLTLIAAQGEQASFLDVPLMFIDDVYLHACKQAITEDYLLDFWDKEMRQIQVFHKSEVLAWFNSKFVAFRTNAILRAILGSGHDVLNPVELMDNGRIVVVSLEKGLLGAPVSQLLGYVYLTRFWTAALRRKSRATFGLFVDEAHTFEKGALPDILAEGRKFGLATVLANQYLAQFSSRIRGAILGNVGSVVAFRLGEEDADTLSGRFAPEFEVAGLRRLENFNAACSLLVDGAPAPAFSLYVDHVDRTRTAPKRTGDAQARQIRRQSQTFLKAEKAVSRRLAEEKATMRRDSSATAAEATSRPRPSADASARARRARAPFERQRSDPATQTGIRSVVDELRQTDQTTDTEVADDGK